MFKPMSLRGHKMAVAIQGSFERQRLLPLDRHATLAMTE